MYQIQVRISLLNHGEICLSQMAMGTEQANYIFQMTTALRGIEHLTKGHGTIGLSLLLLVK